ncbi:YggT family protein [Chloroflexota bacterium]
MSSFLNLIDLLYVIFLWTMIIRVVLSWINIRPDNLVLKIAYSITEPVIAPLRRITPRLGVIDITPMLAIILLYLIVQILHSALD